MGPHSRTLRRGLLAGILAGCLVVGVLPALAADKAVQVVDFEFTPLDVAVQPGEKVTWTNADLGASHSVHFSGEVNPIAGPSMSFTVERTFPTAGEFAYHCDVHPYTMRGRVFVNEAGTVPTPTATASPTTSPTASPGSAPPPPPPVDPAVVVSGFVAKAAHASFCAKRSRRCKHPGVVLSLQLGASGSVRVTGTLRRRPLRGGSLRRFGTVAFSLKPGSHRVRLPVRRRLTSGRYALELKVAGLTRRVQFRVRTA